ncbi:MAG: FMN-binding protein [Bacillota bacterium]|jgi:RnfABCDGE-type electron transport complex G subunit|nr:FMN-binding protein [Bacillota bacterium]NLU55832.1 FMN-binding protein [Bacillota bacterium]HOA91168.1 FMN-binding protein [Bacillota bacterium]HOL13618.1 FMN-binding protein [Bacillota bacterium]HOP53085.1 FMN-binding protein [Bacillota bacterium]
MKKNSIFKMVVVLVVISVASGLVLTLANSKLGPIIAARESDKMRIVAQELLPEGATITKVTRYTELASLVSSARTAAGLSATWTWDPNAAPVETTVKEPEPAPAVEPVIDMDAWAAFFTAVEEPQEPANPWAEYGIELVSVDNTPKEISKTWEDFGVRFASVDNTPQELEKEVPVISWADFGLEVATVSTTPEPEVSVPTFSWEDFGLEAPVVVSPTPSASEAPAEEEPEEEAPSFEIYQAVQGGKLVGVAIVSKAQGYGGDVVIMVALDGTLESILGIRVLQQKETAGLGTLITEPKFTSQFEGKATGNPFEVGVDVDGVSGATVSSRAVTTAIKQGLMNLEQFLKDGTVKEGA